MRLADKYATDLDNAITKKDDLTAKRTFKEGIENLFSLYGVVKSLNTDETNPKFEEWLSQHEK